MSIPDDAGINQLSFARQAKIMVKRGFAFCYDIKLTFVQLDQGT